jgi:hypothetical protein
MILFTSREFFQDIQIETERERSRTWFSFFRPQELVSLSLLQSPNEDDKFF